MNQTTPSLAMLVERIGNGDEAAMHVLIGRYGRAMEQLAEQQIGPLLRSQLDAGDVLQEVLISLWQGMRAKKFTVSTSLHLLRLTKTLIARQVARFWRRAKTAAMMSVECDIDAMVSDLDRLAVPDEPGRQLELEELDEALAEFLHELEPVDRRLMGLRLLGHSTAEAAQKLRVKAGALRARLSRLRLKFQGTIAAMLDHVMPRQKPRALGRMV